MKLPNQIKTFLKPYKKEISLIIKEIHNFDKIAIFRHATPDYDALGTQYGLATWLKDNFPNKDIHVLGDNHYCFTKRLYPETDRLHEDWFNTPFLAIVVDLANLGRISDPRYKKANKIIKIDHHPEIEKFGDISIVSEEACAASELIANILFSLEKKYIFSKQAASYFYTGLVGDSGRFQYSSTSLISFLTASMLLDKGIDITDIYEKMYQRQLVDLKVTAYIIDHYHLTEKGVAYYVLSDETLKELGITTERGKDNVNLFHNIEGINVWCSITEDKKDKCWRVSIRSKQKEINQVGAKWRGGGHQLSSGAKLKNINELDDFIKDLDDLFNE